MRSHLSLLLLLFGLGLSAHATTYYVNASTGSNGNACTVITSPCLTITGAVGKATAAGSIVQVAAGTYNESLTLNSSGTSGNPITYRGQDGTGCPTTPITDVNNPTGNRPNSGVIVNGGATLNGINWINIDCFFFNGASVNIDINQTTSHLNFTNNVLSGTTALGTNCGGIFMYGAGTIQSSTYSNNNTFDHNFITQCSVGIFGPCSSCTISNNEIFNLQGAEPTPGSDHDYMDLWGIGTAIRHNYMHGNTINSCDGYDCHMDCIQTWNNTADGTEVAQNITFDRNICFNHHEGMIAQDNSGNGDVSNWTITNNVFAYGPYDDGSGHPGPAGTAHSWCWVFENGAQGTSNFFWNNTCIDGTMGFRTNSGSASYKNNVFYSYGTDTSIYSNAGATVTGANNLDYAVSQAFTSPTFTGDIINQNPQFVNVGTGAGTMQCIGCNFTIQSSSAAKNAGVNTSPTVTVDLLGTARPQSTAYDIGAYEFVVSTPSGNTITPGAKMTGGVTVQ